MFPLLAIGTGLIAGIATIFVQSGLGKRSGWQPEREIMVVTRESGSGTRSAFLDLFDLQTEEGEKRTLLLTGEAVTVNRSGSLLAMIAGNPYARGYGSLQDHLLGVKAIQIDRVEPTIEHMKDGSYPYTRPFYIAVRKEEKEGQAFLQYVLSAEGQRQAEEAGYLACRAGGKTDITEANFTIDIDPSQEKKLVLAGSSTVMPLAQQWAEGYQRSIKEAGEEKIREIELQESDSGSGMALLLQGSADVALLSRDLTKEEREQVIWAAVAMDGLVILVNEQNPVESLTKEEIRRIFMGADSTWKKRNQ